MDERPLSAALRRQAGRYLYETYRYSDSPLSRRMRKLALKMQGAVLGADVKIGRNVSIDYPENLRVGSRVSIQESCYLSAYGRIVIGDDVSIGRGTSIVSSTHPFREGEVIRKNALTACPVTIEDNVWIGMNASILGGVTIRGRSVVGAMTLVNKDVDGGTIVGGVPAKVIGSF